jgi:hypothetical protein
MLALNDIAPTFNTETMCGDLRSKDRIGGHRAVQLSSSKDSKPLLCAEVRRNADGSIDMAFYRHLAHSLRQQATIQFARRMRESSLARLRKLRRILSKSQVAP